MKRTNITQTDINIVLAAKCCLRHKLILKTNKQKTTNRKTKKINRRTLQKDRSSLARIHREVTHHMVNVRKVTQRTISQKHRTI